MLTVHELSLRNMMLNTSYLVNRNKLIIPGMDLLKFEQYDGIYWKEVYRELDTVIYQVIN